MSALSPLGGVIPDARRDEHLDGFHGVGAAVELLVQHAPDEVPVRILEARRGIEQGLAAEAQLVGVQREKRTDSFVFVGRSIVVDKLPIVEERIRLRTHVNICIRKQWNETGAFMVLPF